MLLPQQYHAFQAKGNWNEYGMQISQVWLANSPLAYALCMHIQFWIETSSRMTSSGPNCSFKITILVWYRCHYFFYLLCLFCGYFFFYLFSIGIFIVFCVDFLNTDKLSNLT